MINTITLMGRLVRDAELRTTESGKEVASFTVAVQRSHSRNGETDFIPVVAWEKTAKFVCDYFRKGSMIALTGELQTRKFIDGDGDKRTAFEVVAREVSFCGSKENEEKAASDIRREKDEVRRLNDRQHDAFSQNADFEELGDFEDDEF